MKKPRNKIYQHVDSTTHKAAENVLREKNENKLGNFIAASSSSFDQPTEANFRTVYAIAKESMSFKKLEPISSLQQLNGLKIGSIHHSDHACANITDHIRNEIREEMVSHIEEEGQLYQHYN